MKFVPILFLIASSFLWTGCQSDDSQEQKRAAEYQYLIDHELFTARFPLEPKTEMLPQNEVRYQLITNEITYVIYVGTLRYEVLQKLNEMSTKDGLLFIAETIRSQYSDMLNYEIELQYQNQPVYFTLVAPKVDVPSGEYAWFRSYIIEDRIIQILMSSPERDIIDRELKNFVGQFRLK
jgi:hypothetical protein